jgi:hypothetical protein
VAAETYGDGVTLEKATPIADLMAAPESFEGQTVRVEGEVNAVCENMGCWMMLKDGAAEVRIKVDDGVIVFPLEAIGQRAAAQGEVSVKSMERSDWVAWHKHLADEAGESFDEEAVGEGPFLQVQIAGSGAEIPSPAQGR